VRYGIFTLILIASGCSSFKYDHTITKQINTEEVRTEFLSSSLELSVDSYPTDESPNLGMRLEVRGKERTLFHDYFIYQEVQTRRLNSLENALRETGDEFESNPVSGVIAAALYIPLFPIFGGRVETRTVDVPNSNWTEQRWEEKEGVRRPVSGDRIVAEGLSDSITDKNGTVSIRARPDFFEKGIRIAHETSGKAVIITSQELMCRRTSRRGEELLSLARGATAGHTAYEIARIGWRLSRGLRVHPVAFVVITVLEAITLEIIEYAVVNLAVQCYRCGTQWDVSEADLPTTHLECPKCQSKSSFHVTLTELPHNQ